MKTVQEVNEEINDISLTLQAERGRKSEDKLFKPAEVNRMKKRIAWLKEIKMYLETQPTAAFIKKECERLENSISLRMMYFVLDGAESLPKTTITKLKRDHEKKHDIPKLRQQVKTMRFILK